MIVNGRLQTALAIIAAALCIAALVLTTSEEAVSAAARLAGFGFLIFVGAVVLGSSGWAGAATIPVLGAALIDVGLDPEPDWLRAGIVGALWFVSLELGWDAIERRDGHRRSSAVNRQKTIEVVTVVLLTLGVAVVVSLLADVTVQRTLLLQAAALFGLAIGLALAIRHLRTDIRS